MADRRDDLARELRWQLESLDASSKSDVARFERHTDRNGQVTTRVYLNNGHSFEVTPDELGVTKQVVAAWLHKNGYDVSQYTERFSDYDGNTPINVDGTVLQAQSRKRGWFR
jgi:hypothetical protein